MTSFLLRFLVCFSALTRFFVSSKAFQFSVSTAGTPIKAYVSAPHLFSTQIHHISEAVEKEPKKTLDFQ